MIVSVALVMSLDGKLTRHDEPDIQNWVSDEDQEFFRPLVASHEVVIMGRNTYEAIRPRLRLGLPIKRIVLTSKPENFSNQAMKDRLEFRNEQSPKLLIQLSKQGVKKVLIVGGPQIIGELLRNKLIDYLFVTIEPRLFGQGISFLDSFKMDCKLTLIRCEQLNKQGTLLLKYKIVTLL